nr:carotenoid 9,10(9',10')-cleavage dioxygenase 1-like [Ipomoea batatas]
MASSNFGTLPLMRCSLERPSSIPKKSNNLISTLLSSSFKPLLRELQLNVPTTLKETSVRLLDAFVDLVYEFKDQPWLPSQANFAPVEEREEAIVVYNIQGIIPHDFPEGVYLRNGANPIFGGLKIAESIFGKAVSCGWEVKGEYAITENHLLFEIDISTLQTLGSWDVNGGWTRPFTSHAKVQCDIGFSNNVRCQNPHKGKFVYKIRFERICKNWSDASSW